MTPSSSGTGHSPKICPRPPYPSRGKMMWRFVGMYLVQVCGLGCVLARILTPIYEGARQMAIAQPMNDRVFVMVSLSFLHSVVYVAMNLPYFLWDHYQWHQSHKLFRKPYMQPSSQKLWHLAQDQFLSNVLFVPLAIYVIYPYVLAPNLLELDAPIPSWRDNFARFFTLLLTNEILFYVVHRSLHSKWLYATIHKQHHTFAGAVGYAAEYAHPVEGILANQFPTLAGILVWLHPAHRCHYLVLFLWVGLRLVETYQGHSGYTSWLVPRSNNDNTTKKNNKRKNVCQWQTILECLFTRNYQIAHHDFHHTHNQGNFGSLWVDYLFGTMDHYQQLGGYEGYLQLSCKQEDQQHVNFTVNDSKKAS